MPEGNVYIDGRFVKSTDQHEVFGKAPDGLPGPFVEATIFNRASNQIKIAREKILARCFPPSVSRHGRGHRNSQWL